MRWISSQRPLKSTLLALSIFGRCKCRVRSTEGHLSIQHRLDYFNGFGGVKSINPTSYNTRGASFHPTSCASCLGELRQPRDNAKDFLSLPDVISVFWADKTAASKKQHMVAASNLVHWKLPGAHLLEGHYERLWLTRCHKQKEIKAKEERHPDRQKNITEVPRQMLERKDESKYSWPTLYWAGGYGLVTTITQLWL